MPTPQAQRDLENDYLQLAYRVEDLLHRKAAAHRIESELQQTHLRMMELARAIKASPEPRDLEREYLAAFHMSFEFEQMQQQMEALGSKLGWSPAAVSEDEDDEPYLTDRISRLQSEIQELRAALS